MKNFRLPLKVRPVFLNILEELEASGEKVLVWISFFCGLFKPKKNHEFIIEGCLTFYFLGAGGGEIYSES